MTDRFDKFTERARKTLQLAQEESQRLNHNYIGTEHILLGLVREGDGVAARVLSNLGVDLHRARQEVEAIIGQGNGTVRGEIGLTPRAKRVIELAVDEARRLNHHYIGTEHLLLGLVREGEGVAAEVLLKLGVSLENVRAQVIEVLKSSRGYPFSRAQLNSYVSDESASLRDALGRRTYAQPPEGPFGSFVRRAREAFRPPHEEVVSQPSQPEAHGSNRFDFFTERARKVLRLSQEEAQRFNHNYIGTEHILLGLVREGDGVAARVLNDLGIELHKVRSAVEFIIGRGDRMVMGEIGLTPRAKRVIELAIDEARRLRDQVNLPPGVKEAMDELKAISKEKEELVASEQYDRAAALREREAQLRQRMAELDEGFQAEMRAKTFYVGTEHLLLGLLREGEGIAAGVLESLGVSLEKVRTRMIDVLQESGIDVPLDARDEELSHWIGAAPTALALEQIRTMFDYSMWARDKLLPVIGELEEQQLRVGEHKGVYGSIHDTLAHMAVSEWMWMQRVKGESPAKIPKGEDFADLRAIVRFWDHAHAEVMRYLAVTTSEFLDVEVTYTGPDGKERTRKVWHMLLQVTNHQTEHRAQIGTILGTLGVEVPQTDLVVYLSERAGA